MSIEQDDDAIKAERDAVIDVVHAVSWWLCCSRGPHSRSDITYFVFALGDRIRNVD